MTYQEKFEELRENFNQKAEKYLKADKEFASVNGFFDFSLLTNLSKAKAEMDIASNKYHSFLSLAKERGVNPNDNYLSDES